jgi:hypothetical protein
MKPNRDANALAAALTSAAAAPLPLPKAADNVVEMPERAEGSPLRAETRPAKKAAREKAAADTVAITLRPERELLNRYTLAAAERMKKEGRAVSPQEIMLEVLQRGRLQVQS